MLSFFRRNTTKIGWTIVLSFAATMFAGSLFLFQVKKADAPQPADLTSIASIGEISIPLNRFNQFNQQLLIQVAQQQKYRAPRPDDILSIRLNALQQATNFALLLEGANRQDIKVNRIEKNSFLQSVYAQAQVKNKKEFKALLKDQNIPFKLYMSLLEQDMLVQKMNNAIAGSVKVTDKDVDNFYTELSVQHILVRNDAAQKLAKIRDDILAGVTTFEKAAQDNSTDTGSKENGGNLGWVRFDGLVRPFATKAFSLGLDELSEPVQTSFGYHLIKVTDRRTIADLDTLDYEKEKQQITQFRQNLARQTFFQNLVGTNKLEINDPILRAATAVQSQDFAKAIGEFQKLSSQAPNSPIPHYFIGQIQREKKNPQAALEELKRAELKNDLAKPQTIPAINIELARLYRELNQRNNMWAQYAKAFEYGKQDLTTLEALKKDYQELKSTTRLKAVNTAIDEVKALISGEAS